MLLTLILSALAGAAVPFVEPKLTDFLATSMSEEQMPPEGQRAILTFALLIAVVSIVLSLSGVDPSALILMLGGVLGLFWKRIQEALLNRGV